MAQRCIAARWPAIFGPALTAITRYKLRKLLKYGLVTLAVAWVLTLFSGDRGPAYLGAWLLLGLWTGVLEEFFLGRRFRALAIPLQFLGKVLLVNLFTVALLSLALLAQPDVLLPGFDDQPGHVGGLFAQAQFYRIALRVAVVTSIAILVVQLEELMGRRMFLGFLLGRFERPTAEERIVLTIDLVGSTTLAEQLGDLRYYRFLNTTYSLMTDAVLRNEADIHKYIGDEVIFTWPMRSGLREANCLDLFFDIQERIAAHAEELRAEFGVVPEYRGALHGGRLISAQIGHIKRAIDFSGDVMNTVSRMLGLCKGMKVPLLVSAGLLERIPGTEARFRLGEEQLLPVRGRKREIRVRSVERQFQEA